MHYQPKVDLVTGRACGAEALVRWEHPVRGLVSPDDFVPVAEQTGLVHNLTGFVLGEALRRCRAWEEEGHDLAVAVNVSARVLHDAAFPDLVARLLRRSGVAPAKLTLEITETMIMADPARSREVLGALRRLGVELAVDDYGTGHSTLAYLKRLWSRPGGLSRWRRTSPEEASAGGRAGAAAAVVAGGREAPDVAGVAEDLGGQHVADPEDLGGRRGAAGGDGLGAAPAVLGQGPVEAAGVGDQVPRHHLALGVDDRGGPHPAQQGGGPVGVEVAGRTAGQQVPQEPVQAADAAAALLGELVAAVGRSTAVWSSAPNPTQARAVEGGHGGGVDGVGLRPPWPASESRARVASWEGTSTTRSPAATGCWARSRPSPPVPSTAQVRSDQVAAQANSRSRLPSSARSRSRASARERPSTTAAVWDASWGSMPMVTTPRTSSRSSLRRWG